MSSLDFLRSFFSRSLIFAAPTASDFFCNEASGGTASFAPLLSNKRHLGVNEALCIPLLEGLKTVFDNERLEYGVSYVPPSVEK